MFKVTAAALTVLDQAIAQEQTNELEKLYVRLSMGIGWGGPQLKLSLEEQPISGDQVHAFDHVDILIHENDFNYFDHTKLDYIKDVLGKGKFQLLKI